MTAASNFLLMNNGILAAKGSWCTAEFCRVTETVTHYFAMYSNLAVYHFLYFLINILLSAAA